MQWIPENVIHSIYLVVFRNIQTIVIHITPEGILTKYKETNLNFSWEKKTHTKIQWKDVNVKGKLVQ